MISKTTEESTILTAAEMHTLGVECLRKLGVCEQYVKDYEENGAVYLFENFETQRITDDSKIALNLVRFEHAFGVTVYAVTHEYMDFGECYSFMCVSKYAANSPHLLYRLNNNTTSAYAYVHNCTRQECSGFGYVLIRNGLDSIRRVG